MDYHLTALLRRRRKPLLNDFQTRQVGEEGAYLSYGTVAS